MFSGISGQEGQVWQDLLAIELESLPRQLNCPVQRSQAINGYLNVN